MVNKVIAFFQRFLATGIKPSMHETEQRRYRLLNFFYLVSSFTLICSVAETFINEGTREGLIVAAAALIYQAGAIPLFNNRRKFAEYYFIVVGNICLFVFDNMYGKESGTYLYYFPFVIFIAFLVDFKKIFEVVLHLGITFSFIIISFFLDHKFLYREFPAGVIRNSFNTNFVVSTLMMAAVAIVIVRMMYAQFLHFNQRMEERSAAEESMKLAIREKETLLAEVHHRVKNNLAVITSLLNLQMNVVNNEYTRNVLLESKNRISSMALIHQKLYQHSNVEEIDFGAYANELVQEIRRSYPRNTTEAINISLEAEHIPLSLTKAVPAGLILNELLSNCYKHAFREHTSGNIFIRFKKSVDQCVLEVEDNGVGLSGDFKMEKQESLGMTIIQSLAEQIDGSLSMSGTSGTGTRVKISFKA
ncbi:MAG: sensor histidine kinase [Bacteroidota bacterium]|nr:sensor histidine kinase [Bacteroidota bacterium]